MGLGASVVVLIIILRWISKTTDKDGDSVRDYIPKSEKYYLPNYRYLELKAFCRQYQQWQAGLIACYGIKGNGFGATGGIRGSEHSDPTERAVELAEKYRTKIDMVEEAANKAETVLAPYILLNVTQGMSYNALINRGKRPPCGVNQFYEARQRFFWELDQLKE